MKVGIALSGCSFCGTAAGAVLERLKRQGVNIHAVSACGLPAVGALLYAEYFKGNSEEKLQEFLQTAYEFDLDIALDELSNRRKSSALKLPISIAAVDIPTSRPVFFSGEMRSEANPIMLPIDNLYDALNATISSMNGLMPYSYQGYTLCDYACRFGPPLSTLRMAGADRIISIAFLPKSPKTPYEISAIRLIELCAADADIHIKIAPPQQRMTFWEYCEFATDAIESYIKEIFLKILFKGE